ncbi:MAG: GAF domain-containing protein, partial [Chloroflexi bacterium]
PHAVAPADVKPPFVPVALSEKGRHWLARTDSAQIVSGAALRKHPLLAPLLADLPQKTAALAAPLVPSGETQWVGVVLLLNVSKAANAAHVVGQFIEQHPVAAVVQNDRLQMSAARHNRELNLINQMTAAFADPSALQDVQSACRVILDQPFLKELFSFDVAEICLLDEETQTLRTALRLPEDSDGTHAGEQYRPGEGYTGWIASRQTSLLIGDIASFKAVKPKVGVEKFPYGSFIGVPLKLGARFLGTLELVARATEAFAPKDVTLLEIVSHQVAAALENVRLFSQTNQQLQRRVDELAGLQRVSEELNSTLDMKKILGMVLQEAMQLTRADYGDVYFYNAGTGMLAAYQGVDKHLRSQHRANTPLTRKLLVKEGIIGRAIQTNRSILVADVLQDEDYVDLGYKSRSKVVVPISYAGEAIGVINLESRQLNFFNTNQLRYLEALSNHAAVAIGNAQAYQQQIIEREQASRRAEQLSRISEISDAFRTNRPLPDVLEDIAFAISESVGFDVVLISRVKGSPPKIFPEVGAGIPIAQLDALKAPEQAKPLENLQVVMSDEFRVGQSFFVPAEQMDVWQDKLHIPYIEKQQPAATQPQTEVPSLLNLAPERSLWQSGDLLLVPLTDINNQVIGLLTVSNPVDGRRPAPEVIRILETFANHAAAAIENTQLFQREKQRRKLADTLRGVAEAISSQLELDELLNIILQELSRVVNYGRANIQLLQGDRLVIIGGRGWEAGQKMVGTSFSMTGDNPNRRVIETQEPVIIKNTRQEFAGFFTSPYHAKTKSWLGVPLTYGTNILGLMALDKDQPNFFSAEDVDVILAFANQVAVALQNARLFDEAREQVRQLAALTEVAQSLNRALDLNEVLNLVLDAVFDLVGDHQGSIWLIDKTTGTMKMADTKNIPGFLVELFNDSDISIYSEPFASVIESGEVLLVHGNTRKDTITSFGLPLPDDVTYVPLKTEEAVIGIFAIETVIQNRNMLKLVTTLADLAAVAIESARLLEDTRRRATEMQSLYNLGVEVSRTLEVHQVCRSVINNALTLTNTDLGTILLLDDETDQQIVEYATNPSLEESKPGHGTVTSTIIRDPGSDIRQLWGTLMERITTTQQPVILPAGTKGDDQDQPARFQDILSRLNIKAVVGVPIYDIKENINGAIFVAASQLRHFDAEDVQLLSFVGSQASVAIRNAQLVQRLNQLTEELEQRVALRTDELARTLQDLTEERDRVGTLYQIARELSASFDLDRVLNEALNLINRAIGISQGSILLLEKGTGHLVYRAALGRSKPLRRGGIETPYKVGYGLAGRVVENREPRLVSDLRNDPYWVSDDLASDERRAAIAVPLSTGDDVLGVLMLFHPEPDYFTADHLKLVTAASAQIATAVNNAELYRLLTDQAKRLGTMFRKQSAEAAKNQAILKGITDGVLVLDAKHDLTLVNPKAAEILNINPDEVVNQPVRQILGRSESPVELELAQLLYNELQPALKRIGEGESSAQFRIEVGPKAVTVSLAPVMLGTEEQPSIVAVLRDISREAEIERLKNEFISTVSHELRTPMTSIKGYADLLLSGNSKIGELNQRQHHFVKVIQSNANRLTELVNDILEISRIETGRVKLEFTSLNIINIIREVAISFEGQFVKKAMHLNLHLPDSLPNVYADKARLTQVLVNLLGNGWQYTPEGGQIDVYAKLVGGFVQVDVSDTGIGIVEKDIAYIFDRFFRSERTEVQVVDGTGLGLSITKSFVELLGGQIWVKSQLDVGTTFSFTVPLDLGQGEVIDQLASPVGAQLLVVSDDKAMVAALKSNLQSEGYRVATTADVQQALKIARQARHTLKAILLDAVLHEANAFATLEQLLAQNDGKQIPIYLTAFSMTPDGMALHIVDSITRNSNRKQILGIVNQIISARDPAAVQTQTLSGRPPVSRILVIEQDRETANWLREMLSRASFEVHCAFNSQQGLDMALNRPSLIFLNTNMPDVDNESILVQLQQDPLTKNIPVVLITDQPVFSDTGPVKIWGKAHWQKIQQPIPLKELITELPAVKDTSPR